MCIIFLQLIVKKCQKHSKIKGFRDCCLGCNMEGESKDIC